MTPPAPLPRLAVRAVLLHEDRLLLVNAYAGRTDLWCAPGGGVLAHDSLPQNLQREVQEETGLEIAVDAPCLVNEFHDPERGFHQVEVFFRCRLLAGDPEGDWRDTEGVVGARRWVTRDQMEGLRVKPEGLKAAAWPARAAEPLLYDPLEPLLP
ncbi:NUDIX domain-containing protein [Pseudoroseicyclus aestuarii]|uniref:ADP-ribose pyrophosphatase YjhB (NUDIX family) n=1 Tax=Pseudoroseicyclus aestuarii TaxID=1795041 RepID=A0A318SYR1_9RHOB|nr:NUDIX hydrolase [Pseudoroseicyclus aestuarii]PYE85569.1 ADP-ribose pyrophosphatase YjhB (NUDIX family) [Pseudoroseicyclus aestuarii]